MRRVGRAGRAIRGGNRGEYRSANAEADLLALHVAADLSRLRLARRLGHMGSADELWIASLFSDAAHDQTSREERRHDPQQDPPLASAPNHSPEGVRQRGWKRHDRQHLHNVGQRRGILIGMRGVGVEKPTAIRAEFFDEGERRHGPCAMVC